MIWYLNRDLTPQLRPEFQTKTQHLIETQLLNQNLILTLKSRLDLWIGIRPWDPIWDLISKPRFNPNTLSQWLIWDLNLISYLRHDLNTWSETKLLIQDSTPTWDLNWDPTFKPTSYSKSQFETLLLNQRSNPDIPSRFKILNWYWPRHLTSITDSRIELDTHFGTQFLNQDPTWEPTSESGPYTESQRPIQDPDLTPNMDLTLTLDLKLDLENIFHTSFFSYLRKISLFWNHFTHILSINIHISMG